MNTTKALTKYLRNLKFYSNMVYYDSSTKSMEVIKSSSVTTVTLKDAVKLIINSIKYTTVEYDEISQHQYDYTYGHIDVNRACNRIASNTVRGRGNKFIFVDDGILILYYHELLHVIDGPIVKISHNKYCMTPNFSKYFEKVICSTSAFLNTHSDTLMANREFIFENKTPLLSLWQK